MRSFRLQVRVTDLRLNAADTRSTQANSGSCLFPGKAEDGGQQNSLSRAHFANGFGSAEKLLCGFDDGWIKFSGP
jgi:hypothetical protein